MIVLCVLEHMGARERIEKLRRELCECFFFGVAPVERRSVDVGQRLDICWVESHAAEIRQAMRLSNVKPLLLYSNCR